MGAWAKKTALQKAWTLIGFFTTGTLAVFVWLLTELGIEPSFGADKEKIEVSQLHRSLEAREKTLNEREAELVRRERLLTDKEALLREQMGRYEIVIDELRKKVKGLEDQDNRRVESFRQIYGQMEPKRAAKILNDLELDMSGRILSSLKEEKAAQILGRMSPAKARELTEKFFARRPSSSKEQDPAK